MGVVGGVGREGVDGEEGPLGGVLEEEDGVGEELFGEARGVSESDVAEEGERGEEEKVGLRVEWMRRRVVRMGRRVMRMGRRVMRMGRRIR